MRRLGQTGAELGSNSIRHVSRELSVTFLLTAMSALAPPALSATADDVQRRIDDDVEAGMPIVVHVVVALCDNENQGIVPVPKELGNGQDPRSNLYWGALYGVKTHLSRAGWEKLDVSRPEDESILDRVLFFRSIERLAKTAKVYVVADAWRGDRIRDALTKFFAFSSGRDRETVRVQGTNDLEIKAGGSSHLVAYVGHNGLMDFSLAAPSGDGNANPHGSLVLACASKPYFEDQLRGAGAHPVLLTTGLMAPEAYTLDAAIRSWFGGGDVVSAAFEAYDRYQKCGLRAARGLFWAED